MTIVFLSVLLLVVAPAMLYGVGWAVNQYVFDPRRPGRLAANRWHRGAPEAVVPVVKPAD